MWPAARSPANRASVGKPGPSREQGRPRRTPARKADRRTGHVPPNGALLPPASRFESQSFVFSEARERERMLGLQHKIGFLGLPLRREEAKAPLSRVPFPTPGPNWGPNPALPAVAFAGTVVFLPVSVTPARMEPSHRSGCEPSLMSS